MPAIAGIQVVRVISSFNRLKGYVGASLNWNQQAWVLTQMSSLIIEVDYAQGCGNC